MTTQASPASIKSRFACKAQPHDRFSKRKTESLTRRSDRAFHARHEIGHGIAVSVKSRDMRVTFYPPDPALLERVRGYRRSVSPEPTGVYRGYWIPPIGAG